MHINTKTLATLTGVSRVTLLAWHRAGLIPAPIQAGRETVYSPDAVAAACAIASEIR